MSNLIYNLGVSRRATKIYNGEIVDNKHIEYIIDCAIQAPTSIGLQNFRILNFKKSMVSDFEKNATNGDQPKGASNIIVFVTPNEKGSHNKNNKNLVHFVDDMTKSIAKMKNVEWKKESSESLKKYIYGNVKPELHINNEQYYKKQTYISLGFALLGAEEINVKTTPVEGVNVHKFDEWARKKGYINDEETFSVAMWIGKTDENLTTNIPGRFRKIKEMIVTNIE